MSLMSARLPDCWSSRKERIKYSTPVCERGTYMIGVDGRGPQFEVFTDSATLISVLGAYHQRHREWEWRSNWERERVRRNEQKHLWSGQGQRQHVSEAFWSLTPLPLALLLLLPCMSFPHRPLSSSLSHTSCFLGEPCGDTYSMPLHTNSLNQPITTH